MDDGSGPFRPTLWCHGFALWIVVRHYHRLFNDAYEVFCMSTWLVRPLTTIHGWNICTLGIGFVGSYVWSFYLLSLNRVPRSSIGILRDLVWQTRVPIYIRSFGPWLLRFLLYNVHQHYGTWSCISWYYSTFYSLHSTVHRCSWCNVHFNGTTHRTLDHSACAGRYFTRLLRANVALL